MTTESECRELLCKLLQGTSPVRSRHKHTQLSDHSQFSTPRPVARAETESDDSNLVLANSKFTTSFRRHAPMPLQPPLNQRLASLARRIVSYTSAVTLFAFSLFVLTAVASLEKDLHKDAVIIA
ncbi:MAG: hypothetical protein KVP17_001125 [Porospora cf. gigantea B]|uniref:uncharacterized protein n=1 Tax=Porospora cf. gigantea B TaxID=2853592 RepID=UPI003571839B|nr:MAG: hypothetical protein KVP17_001125 [Porospora cf. gigantea B]